MLRSNINLPKTYVLRIWLNILAAFIRSYFSQYVQLISKFVLNDSGEIIFLYPYYKRIHDSIFLLRPYSNSVTLLDPSTCSLIILSVHFKRDLSRPRIYSSQLTDCSSPDLLLLTCLDPSYCSFCFEIAGGLYYNSLICTKTHELKCEPYHEPQQVNHPFSQPTVVDPSVC